MIDPVRVHRKLLERWRKAMDLVGPGPLDSHYLDAEACIRGLDARGRWADLGSGAGFPGFILAARSPAAQVELIERRQKRSSFLEQAVAEGGLKNAVVRCEDVESLPAGVYDGVISRAYKHPPEVLVDALRLLKPGGRLVLLLALDPIPVSPDFTLLHVEPYTVEGKNRRAVQLVAGGRG